MIRKFKCFFALSIFLVACQPKKQSKYPQFSETKSGLYYHRHNIGEGKNYPENKDFLVAHLVVKTMQDEVIPLSVFKNEKGQDTLHFNSTKTNYLFYEALSLLSEGDSCSFIIRSKSFLDTSDIIGIQTLFKADSLIKMEAKMISIKTPKQQEAERISYQKLCDELAADEQVQLHHFLDTTSEAFPKLPNEQGFYFFTLKGSTGKAVRAGDNLTIRYTGKFLDGTVFDNSTFENEPLNFKLGEPGQVIKGIELALYKMREGETANLLLPSSLAFGSKGSAGGIVSPYKTVTFALEILKIN